MSMYNLLEFVLSVLRRCAGFWGGSADLAPSNMTLMKQFGDFQKDTPQERNLRYGVREHGMGAIANGITLHSPGSITYCATFFIFTGAPAGLVCSHVPMYMHILRPCLNTSAAETSACHTCIFLC